MNYALQARWLVPIDRPPIAGGIVSVANGRIVAIGENLSGGPPTDLGDVALLPGFVNAHTHLEFSRLEQPLGAPAMPFDQWIGAVVRWRRELAAQFAGDLPALAAYRRSAIAAGLAESRQAAVAAVGEIAMPGWPLDAYACEPEVNVVSLLELLGRAEQRVGPLMELAGEHVQLLRHSGAARAGLCPHATYSIHPELLRQTCALSASEELPVAIHVSESRPELELLASHSGPLVDLLIGLNAWFPVAMPPGTKALDYLETLQNAHRALVIHGNYLAVDEIDFLAARRERMSVVYCPRTHVYFDHEPYPLRDMLQAGVRIAVGTDSRASNPDLSILAELRAIARSKHRPSGAEILKMGTMWAAEALGIDADFGSITVGKRALFAAVPIFQRRADPMDQVLREDWPAYPWPPVQTPVP